MVPHFGPNVLKPPRNPLFDVIFSFQTFDGQEVKNKYLLDETGLEISPYPFKSQLAKFDLQLRVFEYEPVIRFIWEYKTALFKKTTIQEMARHYKEIIEAVTGNQTLLLKDIMISHDLLAVKDSIKKDLKEFGF